MNFSVPSSDSNRGFTLVELLVGILIGMLAILVIMQMFSLFEGNNRASTGGADAQTAGMLAINTLSKDIRQAGYGLSALAESSALDCTIQANNQTRSPAAFAFTAAPFIINPAGIPAGDANTDVIMVTYGSSDGLVEGVKFTDSSSDYKVQNPNAFREGDLVLVVPPNTATTNCSIAEITSLPGAYQTCNSGSTPTDVIAHSTGTYKSAYDGCSTTVTANWNGGTGITYPSGGTIFDLGHSPKILVYAVRNGNLTMCDFSASDCTDNTKLTDPTVWLPIATNIVSLKAQYGRDTTAPADGVVDIYDQTQPSATATPPSANCGWQRILTTRIALVARNTQYDKGNVTTVNPTWAGGTIDLSADTTWQHYRYKVLEASIALRNNIWIGTQPGC